MTATAASELRIVSPSTLEPVGVVATTDPASLPAVVGAARGAQAEWAPMPLREREQRLREVADRVLERADEIADLIVAETGKPRVEAFTTEIFPALDTLVWLAANLRRTLAPERVRFTRPHLLHKRGRIAYEPLGVVGVIAPWNFPFSIPFTQLASVVAAGNGAVLKPSELTPLTGALAARLLDDVVPAGLVQVAQGDGSVGAALVEAGVDKIVFTGSPSTGRSVAAAAGARLVPVTLELGGKDPMVVLDDADVDRAVDGALWGSFVNCGQVCSGVERIVVEGALYEPFVEELARRTRLLRLPRDVGPLISEPQRARVAALVDDAVERGARRLTGDTTEGESGWFYPPTVLTDVPADARLNAEEIFGPVVTVERAADERAAVRVANHARYGLGASVWTKDARRARRVARALRAGTVWHNDHAYSYAAAQAPWGGSGESGFGRTHSRHGLYELVHVKFTDSDSGRVPVPWWFPYDDDAAPAFRGALAAIYGRGLQARARSAWRDRGALGALARRYRR